MHIKMTKGALVNLLVGLTIVLLPFYTRITVVDYNRTSKDNLLVLILATLGFMLPTAVRKLNYIMYAAIIYAFIFVVANQSNVISTNTVLQTFYIVSGLSFFVHYYEKHDSESTHYILNAMMIGALIQAVFVSFAYYGHELYFQLMNFVFPELNIMIHKTDPGPAAATGPLGNPNLAASYLTLTSLAFLSAQKKYIWLVVFPLYALFLTHSYMGICSLAVGILYFINLKFDFIKKWVIYLTAVTGMFILPFLPLKVDSGRFISWKKILIDADFSHFLIGKGPGWFADLKMPLPDGTHLEQEHSAYLTIFNLFGLLFFAILAPIFYKFIISKDKNKVFSAILFAAFCNSYGNFSLQQSTVALIMIVSTCICLSEGKNNRLNDLPEQVTSNLSKKKLKVK